MSSRPRSTLVRVPGKALLFGEYGLLSPTGGRGVVLTLPHASVLVRVGVMPLDKGPFLSVRSAFLGPDGLVATRERFESWCASTSRDERGHTSSERYFFSVLFPYRNVLSSAGVGVRIEVLEAFDPNLGLGSSSALLVAVHEGLTRVLGAGPRESFAAALESIHLFQGRGSGYDAQVQRAALGTLSPRLFVVVPGVSCEDVSEVAFASWQRGLARGQAGFSLVASGAYAPTGALLVPTASPSKARLDAECAEAHAALAARWIASNFDLALLPELLARSRDIARRQGLFGPEEGPFARTCAKLASEGIAFKTTGAGHGDALLCLDDPPHKTQESSRAQGDRARGLLAPPFFRLEGLMSKRLPLSLVRLQEKLLAARERGELVVQAGDRGFASAPSNIALVKYWGKKPGALQVPVNASLSFSLSGFRTFTCVEARASLDPLDAPPSAAAEGETPPGEGHRIAFRDAFFSVGTLEAEGAFQRPDEKGARFLRRVLEGVAPELALSIITMNTFPTACGIASSASGFAALTAALGELLDVERHLGTEGAHHWRREWARIGSGSATRSCFSENEGRFVAWEPRAEDGDVPCTTRALASHAAFDGLRHGVVVFDAGRKAVSSSEGHEGAATSPLQAVRVAGIPRAFAEAARALASNDFATLARVAEADAFAMHAVMQTATPPACYVRASTESFLAAFVAWRDANALPVFWTLDAGPNVHLLYRAEVRDEVLGFVRAFAATEKELSAFLENGQGAPAGLVVGREAFRSLLEAREGLLVRHAFVSPRNETNRGVDATSGSAHA